MDNEVVRENYYLESSDCIFHYTKLSTGLEKIIETQRLKYSSLRNTNDPKEYQDVQFNIAGNVVCKDYTKELGTETISNISRLWKDKSRILCFCQNSENNHNHGIHGYSKSRMWSQYADNHKGLCFVFSKEALGKHISNTMNPNEYEIFFENVIYEQKRIQCRTLDRDNILKYGPEEYAYKHLINNYKELFFLKNYDYKDENECRLVLISKNNNPDYLDISSSLQGIIIGDACPNTYNPIIEQFSLSKKIIIRKLLWSNWTPVLITLDDLKKNKNKET